MDRFDGKKVIECQVSDGISKADQLVERAISGDVPVYHAAAGSQSSSSNAKAGGGAGHKIYMQLMNGVSHMLPLVVGGGILIALAFLIDGLSVDLSSLPADQRANFGTITPVAAVLKTLVEPHLVSCFRSWPDLLQWPSVTDRHLQLDLWAV